MWPFNRKSKTLPGSWTFEQNASGTIGGDEPRPFKLPAKPVAKHQTTADMLDYYCQQHKATYERQRGQDGIVRVKVLLPEGDVFVGKGETTLDAVIAVVKKLEAK